VPEKQAVVIVTGSSGFIGEAVCRAFVTDGYSVVGFERRDALQLQPGVTNIPCDVTAEDSVAQAVSSVLRDFAEPAHRSFTSLRTTISPASRVRSMSVSPSRHGATPPAAEDGKARAVRVLEHDARSRALRAWTTHQRTIAARAEMGLPAIESGNGEVDSPGPWPIAGCAAANCRCVYGSLRIRTDRKSDSANL
jgi:uncharacterized protein YbjT (DUF2867 family)